MQNIFKEIEKLPINLREFSEMIGIKYSRMRSLKYGRTDITDLESSKIKRGIEVYTESEMSISTESPSVRVNGDLYNIHYLVAAVRDLQSRLKLLEDEIRNN